MVKIYIKLLERNASIGGKFCFKGITEEVKNVEHIKEAVKKDVVLEVFADSKWINGRNYFRNELITNKKEEVKVDNKIPFTEIFDGHWTKQVQKVEEYDDIKVVEQILEYAKNNDVSDGVIKRIKEHLETL